MNSLRKAWYHLQMAKEYFEDTKRQHPGTVAASCSKVYAAKIDWMKLDFASHPSLPGDATSEFRKEIHGDTLFPAAIAEKVLQLPLEVRDNFEQVLDMILSGEKITIQTEK